MPPLKIFICAKPVLDPDAVNAVALSGRLTVDQEARWLSPQGVPILMNAFDEQAIEAALRLRDTGHECTITVLMAGDETQAAPILRKAMAMGADEAVLLRDAVDKGGDSLMTARNLASAILKLGGADLVLCGRQASDDDQGVVAPAIAEFLTMSCVTVTRAVDVTTSGAIRVTRVLTDGEDVVEVPLPAVVTVSNELGTPRFPTAKNMMDARRKQHKVLALADLPEGGLAFPSAGPHLRRVAVRVPQVQGKCEFIPGNSPKEKALALAKRLHADGLI